MLKLEHWGDIFKGDFQETHWVSDVLTKYLYFSSVFSDFSLNTLVFNLIFWDFSWNLHLAFLIISTPFQYHFYGFFNHESLVTRTWSWTQTLIFDPFWIYWFSINFAPQFLTIIIWVWMDSLSYVCCIFDSGLIFWELNLCFARLIEVFVCGSSLR